MSFSDFKFTNSVRFLYGNNYNRKIRCKAHDIAVANGATNSNPLSNAQASMWVPGVALAHSASTLSTNALPTTTFPAASKCRAWLWSEEPDAGLSSDSSYKGVVGYASVQVASASYIDWDSATGAGDGNFVAISQRAFVRLGGNATIGGGEVNGAGSYIGLNARSMMHSTDQYNVWTDGDNNYWGAGDGPLQVSGYNLILTSTTVGGYQSTATAEGTATAQYQLSAPELLFYAPGPHYDLTNRVYGAGSVQKTVHEKCSGTYAYDTWYHIRMDVIPQMGADLINIYTAPVDGAGSLDDEGVGGETWTLVKQIVIDAGNFSFARKEEYNATHYYKGHGWCVASMQHSPNNVVSADDCFLDKYQILSQDLLS